MTANLTVTVDGQPVPQQREPSAETFGHEPVWINAGYCGGCERCGSREEREVCARCRQWDIYGYSREASVRWPCTSAIVLGLVQREEASR